MKFFFPIYTICFLSSINLSSQDSGLETGKILVFPQGIGFETGQIITKKNDTLHVLVELDSDYKHSVRYKLNTDSRIKELRIRKIKYLKTPYLLYENIQIKNKEYLFKVIIQGEYTLLYYFWRPQDYAREEPNYVNNNYNRTTRGRYLIPIIMFVLRTSEEEILIKKEKDKSLILPYLVKCPELKMFVKANEFALADLQMVVIKMNDHTCE